MISGTIPAKIELKGYNFFLIWALTILVPISVSFLALDYFFEKYSEYAKSEAIANAQGEISDFNDSLRPESFIASTNKRVKEILNLSPEDPPKRLMTKIGEKLGVKPIFAIFRDRKSGRLKSAKIKPDDLKHCVFPPAVLFRKIFSGFSTSKGLSKKVSNELDNKLLLQRVFKTIAPISLVEDKVSMNFSTYLGGEIYLQMLKLDGNESKSHALIVYRGKEISTASIVKNASKKSRRTKVILRAVKAHYQDPSLLNLHSGVDHSSSGVSIISAANHYFIRHYKHDGGVLIKHPNNLFPFLKTFIPVVELESSLKKWQKHIKMGGLMILLISAALFFRISISGIKDIRSLKSKVLTAIILASLFPFATLIASLYMYQNFDNFVSRLNLIQHIEMKIAQNFEEIVQKVTEFETYFSTHPDMREKFANVSEKEFVRLAKKIGQELPFSKAFYVTLDQNFSWEISERESHFKSNQGELIWTFFPRRALECFQEKGKKIREKKFVVKIGQEEIKASFFENSMQAMGGFYLFDQGLSPIWLSTARIIDKSKNPAVTCAILNLKYDLGPILKNYYESRRAEKNFFSETYGQFKIKYAFFPTTSNKPSDYWQGSMDKRHEQLYSNYKNLHQTGTLHEKNDGFDRLVLVRACNGFPHKAIAIAELPNNYSSSNWINSALGVLGFLLLVFTFSSKLLDIFLVNPVLLMAANAEKIARGAETWNLKLSSGDELESLNRSFSEMVSGLKQRNLLKDYVSEDAFSEIEENQNQSLELYPGGEYQELTVLFATIKDFAREFSDQNPEKTINELNSFITIGDNISKEFGGVIDKIIEGTIMIIFRDSKTHPAHHSVRAAQTSIAMQEALTQDAKRLQAGIASGQVISGRIGSYKGMLDFTVIGDTVNMAARLKNEAYESNTGIIVSGSTMRMLKGRARVNFLRRCSIKGKSREFNIYELSELRS